ncbi:FAD-binding oxidoreductase [Sandaracinobacter sp. RS1-74]|uniref:NAD(P)/FAD-dependent oxidoreductase n=1 Tax=Sandaracinobacteroides sayramensis TaxID=2913411 RepID=UPI001EDB7C96|nr:FAD-dependent oxidoreductase [Sandaracinobacteroides sayramensis]MCG2840644.1 FAD-binding oxidoreductase [Sandaracinobacteroides sayramensis]
MQFDFIVIGAGIAGLSAAAALSVHGKVALLEREDQPCHHSSGRSAAIFVRSYGNAAVQALTDISGRLFAAESAAGDAALGRRRGVMIVARRDGDPGAAAPGQRRLSAAEAAARMPLLQAGLLSHAWLEEDAADIDVHAMHMAYARTLRANGGLLLTGFGVEAAARTAGVWQVSDGIRTLVAPVVVNAAGAWADAVGQLFGAAPKGIRPLRRSAALVDPPAGSRIDEWPMVIDVEESVYFKPDAGKLMVSPADQSLSVPCDAWADDMDIAIAIERYSELTGMEVQRVTHSWAGLRSFVADESPLIGWDSDSPGLLWLAALGGFGVQTAPATGALAAALARGSAPLEGATACLLRAVDPARVIVG